jgi:hypothetical protein
MIRLLLGYWGRWGAPAVVAGATRRARLTLSERARTTEVLAETVLAMASSDATRSRQTLSERAAATRLRESAPQLTTEEK